MSLFQWPFKRKQYPGIGNPRFIGDIVAANEAVIDGLIAMSGLGGSDFAILTGLDYTPGGPGTYTPGIFYLNGSFYYISTGFSEGLYLIGNSADTMPQPFDDGNSRNIYYLMQGATTNVSTGASPVFGGNMNSYRIGLKTLASFISAINALTATLGNSAFRNVGVSPGTVAAGDDSRFGYSVADINNLFALKSAVLQLVTPGGFTFTPTTPYQPATKQYVDTNQGFKLRWLGNISSTGGVVTRLAGDLTVTVTHVGTGNYTITHNMGTTSYFVTGIGWSAGVQLASPRSVYGAVANSFGISASDDSSANDLDFQLQIFQYF